MVLVDLFDTLYTRDFHSGPTIHYKSLKSQTEKLNTSVKNYNKMCKSGTATRRLQEFPKTERMKILLFYFLHQQRKLYRLGIDLRASRKKQKAVSKASHAQEGPAPRPVWLVTRKPRPLQHVDRDELTPSCAGSPKTAHNSVFPF